MENNLDKNSYMETVKEEDSLIKEVATEDENKHIDEDRKEKDKREEIKKEEDSEKEDTQELDEEDYDQKSKVIKLKELQQGAKEEIENKTGVQTVSEFIDEEGNAIEARVKGKVTLKMLTLNRIEGR